MLFDMVHLVFPNNFKNTKSYVLNIKRLQSKRCHLESEH
jgi:hypothetical protein